MVFWRQSSNDAANNNANDPSSKPASGGATATETSTADRGPQPFDDDWCVVDDEKVTDLKNSLSKLESELSGIQETLQNEKTLTQAQRHEISEYVKEGCDFRRQIESLVKAGNAQTAEIDGLRREIEVWKKQLAEETAKKQLSEEAGAVLQELIDSSRKEVESWRSRLDDERSRLEDEKSARAAERAEHERMVAQQVGHGRNF